ncbi:hypothetical protein ACSSS7_002583 [Eimeria intestinalis]
MTRGRRMIGLLGGAVFLCFRVNRAMTAPADLVGEQAPSPSAVSPLDVPYPEAEPLSPLSESHPLRPVAASGELQNGGAAATDEQEKRRPLMDEREDFSLGNAGGEAQSLLVLHQKALESQARARRRLVVWVIYCHVVLLVFMLTLAGVLKDDLGNISGKRPWDELGDVLLALSSQGKKTVLPIGIMLFLVFDALFNLLLRIFVWMAKTLYLPWLRKKRTDYLNKHGIKEARPLHLAPEEKLIARAVDSVRSWWRSFLKIILSGRGNNK